MAPEFNLLAALFIAWLMATAGLQKLRHSDYYSHTIASYFPLLATVSSGRAKLFGLLLGAGELSLALLLLVPVSRQVAALTSATLLISYLVAMAAQLIQGKSAMDCGCAGPDKNQQISTWLLVRNALLAAIAALAALPVTEQALTFTRGSVTLLALVFFVLIYLCFEQLLENRPKLATLAAYSRN